MVSIMSALFLGEFVTPLIVLALAGGVGTLATAIAIVGVFAIVLCVVIGIVVRRFPQPALATA